MTSHLSVFRLPPHHSYICLLITIVPEQLRSRVRSSFRAQRKIFVLPCLSMLRRRVTLSHSGRAAYWVLPVAASAWLRSLLLVDELSLKKRAKSGWRRERKTIWAPLFQSFVSMLGVS